MSDIMISYKKEEFSIAQNFANALRSQGWTVWIDAKLTAGERYDDEIEAEIRRSKCVLVLWSRASVESKNVKNEAHLALDLGKLVPVRIEKCDLPIRYYGLHTIDLPGWNGSTDTPPFLELVEKIAQKAGRSAGPAAAASVSSTPDALAALHPEWKGLPKLALGRKFLKPEDVGMTGPELLRLHRVLIEKGRFSAHASLSATEATYGLLTRGALMRLTTCTEGGFIFQEKKDARETAHRARMLLSKLDAAVADAIDYTPAKLTLLTEPQQSVAFQILVAKSLYRNSLEITQADIDSHVSENEPLTYASLLSRGESNVDRKNEI